MASRNSVAPHSDTNEQIVLAGAMLNESFRRWAIGSLRSGDFLREPHHDIWVAICEADKDAGIAKPELVSAKLAARGILDNCGGREYLQAICSNALELHRDFSALQVIAHDLRTLSAGRALVGLSDRIVHRAENQPLSAVEQLAYAQRELRQITEDLQFGQRSTSAADLQPGFVEWLDRIRNSEATVSGLRSGIRRFDEHFGGLGDQRLVVVRGPTGFGKSTLGGQFVFQTVYDGLFDDSIGDVLVYVLEGPMEHFLRRFVAWMAKVDERKLQLGGARLTAPEEEQAIRDATDLLPHLRLRVTRGLRDIDAIEADIRNVAADTKVAGAVIDHAQALDARRADSRTFELEMAAKRLQALADEIESTVVLISQVTKDTAGDLYEKSARAIGENASMVLTVNRGEDGQTADDRKKSPRVLLSVSKLREGEPLDTMELHGDFAKRRIYETTDERGRMAA